MNDYQTNLTESVPRPKKKNPKKKKKSDPPTLFFWAMST